MRLPSLRTTYYLGALSCALMLCIAYYLQIVVGMQPCLLCLLQRWFVLLTGIVLLIAAKYGTSHVASQRIFPTIGFIVTVLGMIAAGRQVWLEHQPVNDQAICAPGIEYLLQTAPLSELFKQMLLGSTDCATVAWRFLGLSMPTWTLFFFVLLAMVCIWQFFRKD